MHLKKKNCCEQTCCIGMGRRQDLSKKEGQYYFRLKEECQLYSEDIKEHEDSLRDLYNAVFVNEMSKLLSDSGEEENLKTDSWKALGF